MEDLKLWTSEQRLRAALERFEEWFDLPYPRRPIRDYVKARETLALSPIDNEVWPYEVKEAAYKLDPECWVSYSGKPREFKRAMDARRTASLEAAHRAIK